MAPDSLASVDAAAADAEGRHAVTFRVARRGYDPAQVDPVVRQMAAEVDGLRAEIAELREREADLLAALDAADDRTRAADRRAEDAVTALAARSAPEHPATAADLTEAPALRGPVGAAPDAPTAPDTVAEPASAPDGAGEPVADVATMVGEETARIIEAARHAAVEIGARARDDGERLVAESREEARLIRADAEIALLQRTREADDAVAERLLEAADAVQQAQNRAQRIVDDAFTEAATIVLRSREEAEALVVTGEQRSAELLAAATEARDELLVDLVRRRKLLRRQVEQLDAGRARLRSAYDVVEGALAAATGELDRSVEEAHDAALAAAERADAEPDAELEAAVSALGAGPHVLAGEVAPAAASDDVAAAVPAAASDDATATAAGSVADAATDLAGESDGSTLDPVAAPDLVAAPDAATPNDDAVSVDEPAVVPANGLDPRLAPAAPGVAAADTADAPALGADGSPDVLTAAPSSEPPPAGTAHHEAVADDAAVADVGSRSGAPSTTEPSDSSGAVDRTGSEPAAGPEPDPGSRAEVAPGSGERRGRRRAPDPIEFEGRWSSAVRVLPPGPDQADAPATEPELRSSRRPRTSASVSEVFARLRSGEGLQQSLFEEPSATGAPTTGPADADAPEAPDPDPEVAWLAQRDASVAPALRALRRRLKATLADDEDALLESIHRAVPVPERLDALRDPSARRQDLVAAMTPSLTVAVVAGAGQVTGVPGAVGDSNPDAVDAVEVDAIAGALADTIIEPLEERLERALARYHRTVDDLDGNDVAAAKAGRDAALASLVSSTKAAYRARRGVQVQVPTEHAVLAAGHRGVVAALVPGTPLRWIVAAPAPAPRRSAKSGTTDAEVGDDGPEPRICPSCVAIADVGAGDPFGHGHLAPPARPGCRCAVAPVTAVVPRRS